MPLCRDDIGSVIRVTVKEDGAAVDISTASTKTIKLQKPSGAVVLKTGTFTSSGSDGRLQYTTIAGDLDEPGAWTVSVYLVVGSWSGHSNRVPFDVINHL